MKENKKINHKDKFTYKKGDIKIIKKEKKVKESYSSFAEFLFEKEEKFVASTMRWITIKDERDRNQHILIKKKDGTVIAGMGGTHNGEKLEDVFKDIEVERKEINKKKEQKPERKRSSIITKKLDNTKILSKEDVKKYISSFRKDAISSTNVHKELSIATDKKISIPEYTALQSYTGNAYSIINSILRDPDYYENHPYRKDDKNFQNRYNDLIKNCHSALKNNKTTANVVAYRGVHGALIEQLVELESGDVLLDEGFVSTSTSKKVAKDFGAGGYLMTVHIPKGSQAASLKDLSNLPSENEILINKKARFEVKYIDHDTKEMIVELLPHEDD